MTSAEQFIATTTKDGGSADHAGAIIGQFEIWSSAIRAKSASGRGSSNKRELYGIKKLRELILELAVRGKLVPQDPADEPASVLLERIAAEKAELVKQNKIKKPKKLPEIGEDEKPFELPVGWEWVRLGDVVDVIRGITFPASEKSKTPEPGRVACLRTANVQDEIEWDDMLFVRSEFVKRDDQYICAQDIVMSMANSRDLVGKVALIANQPERQTSFGGFLSVLRPREVSPRYLMALLRASTNREILIGSASQTTNIANISLAKLNPLVLGVPPLAEQHRIVAKVDELMALCDQLELQTETSLDAHATLVENLLATLTDSQTPDELKDNWVRLSDHFDTLFTTEASIDALKQTILQLAVMGKLVPQDPNDEPASELLKRIAEKQARLILDGKLKTRANWEIKGSELYFDSPASWEYIRLGNLAKFIDYRGKTPTKRSSGIRLITAKNVRFGYISLEPEEFISNAEYTSWMTRGFPKIGDLLFTPEAPLGNVAVIDIEEKFALAQRAICFQLHGSTSAHFLKLVIMSPAFQYQLIQNATGMTAKGIKASRLKEIPVPFPPIAEQHRIVAKVDELMVLCDQLKSRLQQAQQTQLHLADALVEQGVGA